jgi:hypothetical protein
MADFRKGDVTSPRAPSGTIQTLLTHVKTHPSAELTTEGTLEGSALRRRDVAEMRT